MCGACALSLQQFTHPQYRTVFVISQGQADRLARWMVENMIFEESVDISLV